MSDGTGANAFYLLLCLTLVGSSLVARRLPIAAMFKMIAAWVAIFATLYVLFLFRDEGQAVWTRIVADVGYDRGTASGQTLRIPQADDGHFWVTGAVNGHQIRFLIDSGATMTTVTPEDAAAANLDGDGGPPILVQTANGLTHQQPAVASRLDIGPIARRDERVQISSSTGINVLGMNFLSKLKSWKVEGSTLLLQR